MPIATANYKITWEKLPDDFRLPNAPGDDINQPTLAAALTESLEQSGCLREDVLVSTNYGICATLDGKIVVKALGSRVSGTGTTTCRTRTTTCRSFDSATTSSGN